MSGQNRFNKVILAKKKKNTFAMSRRRRAIIVTLCLLLFCLLVWLDHSDITLRSQPEKQSAEALKSKDFKKYHARTFTVVNVVDGDTFDIDIPDGDNKHARIRLWGIDTPETKNPKVGVMYFGPEAAEFVKELTLGKKVTVYLDAERRSRGYYGRLLAYVKLADGRFLNEVLLSEGFAYADVRFKHSFYNKYKQLEAAARSHRKGLWEKVTREQLPQWMQKRKPEFLLEK
ncbi:MAG: thermonuclease family protein [Planctomycetota bacterium]|jgi:endonuclease YncB( thermonuclease family)